MELFVWFYQVNTVLLVSDYSHFSVVCHIHLYMLWRCKWSILYDFTEHIMCYSKIWCEAV